MQADSSVMSMILDMVPQRRPFRFVDEIRELDEEHIVGFYRFRADEYFYEGHFPGLPITPGVILIETMCQTGVVAFGLYLNILRGNEKKRMEDPVTLFTLAEQVEFRGVVGPGELVRIEGRKVYFRGDQIKVACVMTRADSGDEICSGTFAGKGVSRDKFTGGSGQSGAPRENKGWPQEGNL